MKMCWTIYVGGTVLVELCLSNCVDLVELSWMKGVGETVLVELCYWNGIGGTVLVLVKNILKTF